MLAFYQNTMSSFWQFLIENRPDWLSDDEANESTAVVTGTCIILACLWPAMVRFGLSVSKSFRALSLAKQWYVVANLSKVLCLAIVCMHPSFFTDLSDLFNGNIIESDARSMWIKRSTALYISSDLVALCMVPKLPKTTVAHHVITALLAFSLFATKFSCGNITLMIGVYGAWSSLAWPVNLFLALRCMYHDRWWMKYIATLAMIVYVAVCCANWSWHAVWFWNQVTLHGVLLRWYGWLVLAYAFAVAVVARDDLILLKWLWNFTQKKNLVCECSEKTE